MPSTVRIEPKTLLTFMMQQLKRLEFITQLKITQRYFYSLRHLLYLLLSMLHNSQIFYHKKALDDYSINFLLKSK